MTISRRQILAGAAACAATAIAGRAGAQSFPFKPNQRYPEPALEILDPSFLKACF
jgi:gluconolactonase